MFKTCALYKLALTLITSFSLLICSGHAQANPFLADNITVDVTASDAVQARTQAMTKAQIAAWDIMVANLIEAGEPALQYIEKPDSLTIASLVQTMEVRDEQTAPTQYIATMEVLFSETAVRNYLGRTGVRLSMAKQERPTLLIPWYRDVRGQMHLWGEGNLWHPIWATKSGRTDPPVHIPLGDVKDISDLNPKRPRDMTPFAVQTILNRYNLDRALTVTAFQETPQRVRIELAEIAPSGLKVIAKETINANDPNQDEAILLHQALTRTLVMLRNPGQAKAAAIEDTAPPKAYPFISNAQNLQQWVGIKKRLDQAFGMVNVQLDALTPGHIRFTITTPDDLAARLSLYGMRADQPLLPDEPLILREATANYQ